MCPYLTIIPWPRVAYDTIVKRLVGYNHPIPSSSGCSTWYISGETRSALSSSLYSRKRNRNEFKIIEKKKTNTLGEFFQPYFPILIFVVAVHLKNKENIRLIENKNISQLQHNFNAVKTKIKLKSWSFHFHNHFLQIIFCFICSSSSCNQWQ